MRYVSTRGGADPVDFVTASLASDLGSGTPRVGLLFTRTCV